MKKVKVLIIFFLMVLFLSFSAGTNVRPVLTFNESGKFRIVQFTDIHFKYNSYRSDSSLVLMKKVIRKEKPDLVVFTGDIVIGQERSKGWFKISDLLSDLQTPWAVTLGNHDTESELAGNQLIQMLGTMPYNLTENGPGNISGNGNYILKIKSNDSNKTSALLYLFDSHGSFPNRQKSAWDYIKFDQVEWYRDQSRKLTNANGGKPLPSLAFFHIPLTEYREIKSTLIGIHVETITPPEFNSGLFTAMFEAKDVMGIFAGHNHNNNFIGCYNDICLGFGNVSGREGYGNIGRGARVIDLYEGERKFDTWILKLYECDTKKDTWVPTGNDQPQFFASYPGSFLTNREKGGKYIEYEEKVKGR